MKKLGFFLVAVVAVVIALAFFVPQMIPASTYKATLEEKASEQLGRKVSIGDDLGIKIFPTTAFKVTTLQIDNPDGFSSPYLMRVEKAEIGVKLFKLLSRKVEITKFVLTEPTINLEKKKNGSVNWEFANDAANDAASDEPKTTSTNGSPADDINDIRLGDVRIVNGAANYDDQAAGQTFKLDAMNVDVKLSSLDAPLTAKGTLNFQGAPSKLDLVMTTPGQYLRGEKTDMKFALDLADTSVGGDLDVTPGEKDITFAGPVNLNAPDLPALAALMGSPLPEAPGFDNLSVSGNLSGTPKRMQLAGAKITFDEIKAEGDLRLAMTGARPKATGTLTASTLDLRPYVPVPAETSEGFPEWSTEPMDFTSLRNMDANLEISTQNILLNDMRFGESRMNLVIDNGRMTATIPELAMYEGNGSGRLVVNARQRTPSFAGNFKLDKVAAEPFCIDVLKMDNILGLGGFTFNFSASGASQSAIMSSLDGDGGFDVADGALKGINIAKLARTAASFKQGIDPSAVRSAISAVQGSGEATDFSTFLSQFTMNNGIITAPTINLISPVMQMDGNGTINLPKQTIDLRLTPTASLNADGSGGNGVAVPIQVTGTFSNPKVSVDVAALLRGEAGKRLRGVIDGAVGDKLKDSPAGGLLDNVLDRAVGGKAPASGGSDASADGKGQSAEDAVEEAAKSAIGSLFGRRKKEEKKDDGENDPDGR